MRIILFFSPVRDCAWACFIVPCRSFWKLTAIVTASKSCSRPFITAKS